MIASKIIIGTINFIDKFINFHDFLTGFIAFIAVSTFIYFYILNRKMNLSIKDLTKEIENLAGTTDEKMVSLNEIISKKDNNVIKILWSKYYETLLNHGSEGSAIDISSFFNKNTLVDIPTKRKIAEIIPGTLIAMGILGTFIGLVIGLSAMRLENAEAIQNSMAPFLSGIKIGFLASVLAIGSSLLWNVLDRIILHHIVKSVSEFQVAFERTFPEESLGSYLIEMIKIQSAQTVAVEQMTSNMSDAGKPSPTVVEEQVYSKLSNSISNSINKTITPLTDSISDLVKSLSNVQSSVANSNSEVSATNVWDNSGSISTTQNSGDISDKFEHVLTMFSQYQEQTNTNIKELISLLEAFTAGQKQMEQNIDDLSTTLQEKISNGIGSSIGELNESFVSSMKEVTEKLQDGLVNTFDEEMRKVTLHIDNTVDIMEKTLDETAGQLKILDNKLGDKVLYTKKTKRSDGEFY